MHITIQHFNGCPHWLTTAERLSRAVEDTGVDADLRLQLVSTPEAAAASGFRGSPTVLIDGVDPFADPDAPVGLSCRVYATPAGMAGSPTIEQLTEAITNSKDQREDTGMTANTIPQGDLALLDHLVAQDLLNSAIPARLSYIALDGTPRVSPMWFTWNGTDLVLGAAGGSPKVRALQANPRVAVTIDSDTAPYKVLSIRGDARVTIVEGAVDEYADAALRYMGPTHGAAFRDHAKATMRGMARITIKPDWVSLIDFQTRYPATY